MANNVTNIIRFKGDASQIEAMRTAIQDDEYGVTSIDFDKIIPMPEGLWMGGINPDTRAIYGKNNWLDWSIANWGTKWNAYHFACDDYESDKITFYTANTAPHPILKRISEMYPNITMHHQWADDNVGYNCGERTYKGGQMLDEYYPDYGKRAVEFACKVMGTRPADHYLMLNEEGTEYVCMDSEESPDINMGSM